MSNGVHIAARLLAFAVIAVALLLAFASERVALALPPAGVDTVNVSGKVSITGRTGQETIALSGTATIQRATPHMKGSVQASNAEITALSLAGTSVTGQVTVTESPSLVSNGELRSISGSDFPATSFFDVYAIVTMPAAPNPTITLHNTVPIKFTNPSLNGWPPYNAVYGATHNPCILLQPSIQNPAQTCITSATMSLTTAGVGGMTELAAPIAQDERGESTTPNDHAIGVAIVLVMFATFGVMANYARAKLRSDR